MVFELYNYNPNIAGIVRDKNLVLTVRFLDKEDIAIFSGYCLGEKIFDIKFTPKTLFTNQVIIALRHAIFYDIFWGHFDDCIEIYAPYPSKIIEKINVSPKLQALLLATKNT